VMELRDPRLCPAAGSKVPRTEQTNPEGLERRVCNAA